MPLFFNTPTNQLSKAPTTRLSNVSTNQLPNAPTARLFSAPTKKRSLPKLFLLALCFLGFLAAFPSVASALSEADQAALKEVVNLMARWRPDEAEPRLAPLLKRYPKEPLLQNMMGELRYLQGRYKEAKAHYEALQKADKLRNHSTYQSLINTMKIAEKYEYFETKRFRIGYVAGSKEAAVAIYLAEALERGYEELGKVFAYYPKDKIRVDLLNEALELAAMSPLTEEDIVRTGTIALCKYNRLMITSPRSLLKGYRWLDTAVHEFSHLLISRQAAGVPIWLHEGLARYSEALWRQKTPKSLGDYSESILARALKEDKLLTFEQMHPSMAKLPSQELAALGYAQVYTVILYFVRLHGIQAIPKLLKHIHEGKDAKEAVSLVAKQPFDTFLAAWKTDILAQGLRYQPELIPPKKVLKSRIPKMSKEEKQKRRDLWFKPTKAKDIGERFLRLGELLRRQRRLAAALIEYRKAEHYLKQSHPRLQNKIALVLLALRRYQEIVHSLKPLRKRHGGDVTLHVNLGQAYFHLGQMPEARASFEEANQINPFHPSIHLHLRKIYQKLGEPQLAQREERVIQQLRAF